MGNEDCLRQPARTGRFRSGQVMMTRVFERLFLRDALLLSVIRDLGLEAAACVG